MSVRITDTEMSSDVTRHRADRVTDLRPDGWVVSWLPDQLLTRDQATTAMAFAEAAAVMQAEDADQSHRLWPLLDGWAAELGLAGPDAYAQATQDAVLADRVEQLETQRAESAGESDHQVAGDAAALSNLADLKAESDRLFAEHEALARENERRNEARHAELDAASRRHRVADQAAARAMDAWDEAIAAALVDPRLATAADEADAAYWSAHDEAVAAGRDVTAAANRLLLEMQPETAAQLQLGERARASQDAVLHAEWEQHRAAGQDASGTDADAVEEADVDGDPPDSWPPAEPEIRGEASVVHTGPESHLEVKPTASGSVALTAVDGRDQVEVRLPARRIDDLLDAVCGASPVEDVPQLPEVRVVTREEVVWVDLSAVDADLDEVRAAVDHGEAVCNPHALTALRAAERLRSELARIKAAQVERLRPIETSDDMHREPSQLHERSPYVDSRIPELGRGEQL